MQIKINEEKKELKAHGNYAFPVHISNERLSNYERGSFTWHWHPEIELTYVIDGEILYQINDRTYMVKGGEGLFCNSNAIHTGRMNKENDCEYLSITFHPRLISGFEGSIIQKKYVDPIICNESIGGIFIKADTEYEGEILEHMRNIKVLHEQRKEDYEFSILMSIMKIWDILYVNKCSDTPRESSEAYKGINRLRMIIMYIQEHYSEKITLEDISKSVNFCPSECCRFFKKHMNQTIFEYIMEYRIEKSLGMLSENGMNITAAAQKAGFSNPAYYGKIFRKIMKCSPSEYKKNLSYE